MAQSGFTPIKLYRSSTAAAVPLAADLAPGELAINTNDGKLFYEDSSGVVQVIGWKTTPATAGGTGQTSYAVGDLLYASTTTALSKLADIATGNALISGGVGVAPSYGKIGLTTHVSGTLPATNGGTGQASYAVGDLLYAPTTTTVGKLADIATGNALISGGVGVSPSYGKIGLTTHVSGTLPVANGGTNATTASITSFNNITGYSASGATGTTSTNLVFSTSPTLITPALGTPSALVGTNITGTAAGLTAGNVTTNANLTGDVTSVGNATTLTNAPVIAKVLTGYVSGAGVVAATDSILQAIQKLDGNDATNANLTGAVTSVGNATSLGSFTSASLRTALTDETGTGVAVFGTSPAITTSLTTGSTTFALLNTTATTLNIGGGATAVNIGAATGPLTVANTTLAAKAITAATTLGVTGVSTLTSGAVVQGLTVGRGAGAAVSNTVVGNGALATNSVGVGNTAVGLNALNAATIADDNTAIGNSALQSSDTGANNTAVGSTALSNLVTGDLNVAIGDGALNNLDGYASNVAVGHSAMGAAQCDEAVAVGSTALFVNTATGTVGIGTLALYTTTSAVGQTAVGYEALKLSTGDGNTAMGYSAGNAITTGANNTIIGRYTGSAAPISATGSNWIVLSDGAGTVRQAIDSAGNIQSQTGAVVVYAPAAAGISGATTLTNANLQMQLINTTGTSYTVTMPSYATLDSLISWSANDIGFDFSVINTASGTITISAVSSLGSMTIATGTSGRFRIRRIAASLYALYRIS
jgi:hypothetical protein